MRTGKLGRALLRVLAVSAVLAAFGAFDWYPTIRDLGRLRLERNDIERKTREYAVMASRFAPVDDEEEQAFSRSEAALLRSLPLAEREGVWTGLFISESRTWARKDGIRSARCLIAPPKTELEDIETGGGALLANWINCWQANAITEAFAIAADSGRSPWRGTFAGLHLSPGRRLSSRPLAIALGAPLPALLDFVNHISWGTTRLEIVRLHLEPGAPDSRAWMVVRGYFLSGYPSAWDLRWEKSLGDDLLIDPDSPLLWQKVDPGFIYLEEKRALAPADAPPW